MSTSATTSDLQSSLRSLSLTNKSPVKDIPRPTLKTKSLAKKPPVADSWEDEASSSSDENENKTHTPSSPSLTPYDSFSLSPSVTAAEGPLDPPPTPISPQTSHTSQTWAPVPTYTSASSPAPPRGDSSSPARRRPEKQTAVAGRMIAGALGIRAPKRTEEQRAYDRSVKEQEIKRRNREREEAGRAKEEEEKAKMAVWDE